MKWEQNGLEIILRQTTGVYAIVGLCNLISAQISEK